MRTHRLILGLSSVVAVVAACNAIDGLTDVPNVTTVDSGADGSRPGKDGGRDATGDGPQRDSGSDVNKPREGGHPNEGGSPTDAGGDALEAGPLGMPQLLSPLSTARVTSRHPTLRWTGATSVTVDICGDPLCTDAKKVIHPSPHVNGTSYSVPSTIALPNVVFWRVRVDSDATGSVSPTWEFWVGNASAADGGVDRSWGTTLDLNGDGYPDLAIGQYGVDNYTGQVLIYYGSMNGFPTMPSITLTGTQGPGTGFGATLASAGDVNGDGISDLIVGGESAAKIYLGSSAGVSPSNVINIPDPDQANHLSDAFGAAVASAGDVNGDGYADFLVSATVEPISGDGSAFPVSQSGLAYVFYGSSDIATSTSIAHATLRQTVYPPLPYASFGQSLAGAGDINGDGFGDIIVGSNINTVVVYYGSATGPGPGTQIMNEVPDGSSSFFGRNVAGIGDVNGDGYADVAIGDGQRDAGVAYVYLGGTHGLASTPTTVWAPSFLGASAQFGDTVAGAGDFNGDGYADLVVGSPNQAGSSGEIAANVFYGGPSGISPTHGIDLVAPQSPPIKLNANEQAAGFGAVVACTGTPPGSQVSGVIVTDPAAGDSENQGAACFFPGVTGGQGGESAISTYVGPVPDGGLFGSAAFGATN